MLTGDLELMSDLKRLTFSFLFIKNSSTTLPPTLYTILIDIPFGTVFHAFFQHYIHLFCHPLVFVFTMLTTFSKMPIVSYSAHYQLSWSKVWAPSMTFQFFYFHHCTDFIGSDFDSVSSTSFFPFRFTVLVSLLFPNAIEKRNISLRVLFCSINKFS